MLAQGAVVASVSCILEGQSMRVLTADSPGDADSLHISKVSVAVGVKNFEQTRQDGYSSEVESSHPFSEVCVLGV